MNISPARCVPGRKHYLESCPRTLFNSLLIPDEHLTLLQGSPALDFLVERKTEFREMYDALFPKLSDAFPKELPPHKCAWEDFLWAAAIIDTRAWATDAGCDVSSLVPCCDMLNHHRCHARPMLLSAPHAQYTALLARSAYSPSHS